MSNYDLSIFFEHSKKALLVLGDNGKIIKANPESLKVFGLSEGIIESSSVYDLVNENELTFLSSKIEELTQKKTNMVEFETRYFNTSQEADWLSWVIIKKKDHLYALILDISDSKIKEIHFNELQDAGNIGYWRLNLENNEPIWSTKTHEIHEVPIGQKIDISEAINFYAPEARSEVEECVSSGIEDGTPWDREFPFITAKNKKIWVRSTGKPIVKNGKTRELYGTFQDITERKNAQIKLLDVQKRLTESAKLASLGTMAGGIAHEINNPLAIISSNATLLKTVLKKYPVAEKQDMIDTSLKNIEETVLRISKIIQGMKQLVKGSQVERIEKTDFKEMLEKTSSFCIEKLKSKCIFYDIDIKSTAMIYCNLTQISQVIVNLISNAVDAVQETEDPWIKIVGYVENEKAVLKIIDSGGGIPESDINKIFEPFYSSKNNSKGTGLGLSISQQIVELHKGKIYFDGDNDNTCFVLEIPVA